MKIGICFSGGGARGIAHLGIIKALEEAGIKPDLLSGASAGAFVGAFYANGHEPDEILQIIQDLSFYKYVRPAFLSNGLISLAQFEPFLSKYLPEKFEDLKMPLQISATQLETGKSILFSSGNLFRPLLASCCVPGIFSPIEFEDELYVDGGVLNNLPVDGLVAADKIIACHCNPINPRFKIKNIKSVIERSMLMSIGVNARISAAKSQLFIEPPELGGFTTFDLGKAKEIFDIGYTYTLSIMDQIDDFKALTHVQKQ